MSDLKSSLVWGVDFNNGKRGDVLQSLKMLLDKSGLRTLCKLTENVLIKFDMGESGNIRYLRPAFINAVAAKVSEYGSAPILVDTVGIVGNSLKGANDWFETSVAHGFSRNVIPADGYTGGEGDLLPVDGDELGGMEVARGITEASALVIVSHVSGHPVFGLNGALFRQGTGCAAQKGKWRIYSAIKPVVDKEKCSKCEVCLDVCQLHAISMVQGAVRINHDRCKGCINYCSMVCPDKALGVAGDAPLRFQKRVVEAASAVHVAIRGKIFYINLLVDVGHYPDNYTVVDQNIVPDLGVMASFDPVAVDQASSDWIKNSPGYTYSQGEQKLLAPNTLKFSEVFGVDELHALQYAEDYGLGLRKYHMEMIGG